jgi:hypothetical protein
MPARSIPERTAAVARRVRLGIYDACSVPATTSSATVKWVDSARATTDSIQSFLASRIFLSRSAASLFSGSSVRALSK